MSFMVAAAAVAVVNWLGGFAWAGWMTLHLALLGGVSQLVLGSAQFFTCLLYTSSAGLRAAGFTLLATAFRPIGGMLADRIGGEDVYKRQT